MDIGHIHTPCFVLDEVEFKQNLKDFRGVLDEYFLHSGIGYSFKTNSLPFIIRMAKELGCYAETVSDTEYQLAKVAGYEPERIIFNGPIKGREQFEEAFVEGSMIHVDSMREVEWLEELSQRGTKGDIGIRINVDLESLLPGQTSTGEAGGRFGFCDENGKLTEILQRIRNMQGIQIVGFHMHVSNKSKSPEVYEMLARKACEIAKREQIDLKYLDIGGGFFGGGDGGVGYRKYVEAIYRVLKEKQMQNIELIVEPGASVIATAVDYVTEVIDVKDTVRGRFVVTDGSRLHVDPFFHKTGYSYSLDTKSTANSEEQVICGYTCMEQDRFMKLKNEVELHRGDRIVYHVVGGYTMCFNPLFIEYFPMVYTRKKDSYTVVRDKWGVNEYVQKCKWEVIE